ncbi:MAG: hypothetical protein RMN51_08920 [Verrucomicrobiota bacterium]|nr:hypothetical protein [Limisphaera sp.]MDW8382212.1 hypothetical protein [Verrucomicrobiota bacterium]
MALVVTVILISVITFLTVAFLVLTRREKGAVTTAVHLVTARQAAEAGLQRAQAELLAPILAFTNTLAYELRVSTNYINSHGFNPSQRTGPLTPAQRHWATNVSYQYRDGRPLNVDDYRQNLANLWYFPRPPVFVTNTDGSVDFRFYLDLNRNGQYDTNGWLPVIMPSGRYLARDGTETSSLTNAVMQFMVGDPEWVGILERPDQPHSPTNRFVARYAWLAIPASKTLDLNAIHNQAKMLNPRWDGFVRNMGVAPFELNLAAFLADLNTNLWNLGAFPGLEPPYLPSVPYGYNTNLTQPSRGTAFEDAVSLLNYRYAQSYNNLFTPQQLFGAAGAAVFATNRIDDCLNGPLLTGLFLPLVDNDALRIGFAWPGSRNPEAFFNTQDLFDRSKTLPGLSGVAGLTDRLLQAGGKTNSYDRYTFYRLLAQLGTDSESTPPERMHLNFDNLTMRNPVTGVLSPTNFYPWQPLRFFTNAADRLLQAYTAEWLRSAPAEYVLTYGTNRPFGVTNIPVWISNRFVYTPAVHRLLQLAANLYDARNTNRWPSVFRPVFSRQGPDVFISGYEEVHGDPTPALSEPIEATEVPQGFGQRVNVYGVPWVVGVKSGLPNFNEFAMQTVFDVTRKVKIRKPSLNARPDQFQTNQLYIISLTNVLAAEFWNSYRMDYTNPILVRVTGDVTMVLTNEHGLMRLRGGPVLSNTVRFAGITNLIRWPGYRTLQSVDPASFVIPVYTNVTFVPPAIWLQNSAELNTNLLAFPDLAGFPVPRFGLVVRTRLRAVLQLNGASGPILDYVQLNGLDEFRDLAMEFSRTRTDDPNGLAWGLLWDTNRIGGTTVNHVTRGIVYQIRISLGDYGANAVDWTSYGLPPGMSKDWEIDAFRVFLGLSPLRFGNLVNTNLEHQVPFTPSRRISRHHTWQANDPLVHYLASDLRYWPAEEELRDESVKPGVPVQLLENIGRLNKRFRPWGGNPLESTDPRAFDMAIKDPGVRASDDWAFPTNLFPNVGWMGRVHRGTPWQTVYLKATHVAADGEGRAYWSRDWTGNTNLFDALNAAPAQDRLLFDLFTTDYDEISSRGRLSVNQTNLAAWSAVFSGVLALTNALPDTEVRLRWLRDPQRAWLTEHYQSIPIPPAGIYDPFNTNLWPPVVRLVDGINRARMNTNLFPRRMFERAGDIMAAPELTELSPFLNRSAIQVQYGLTDPAVERLPEQVLGLLKHESDRLRFVIYAYGQALRPAPNSLIRSGPFLGMFENYEITAESALRAVVRVEHGLDQPRILVERYNWLGPD